ncbi:MAG TPA: serine/threonine-protein kinase [Gaiellaceae bacterium]|nr:serine/threonine-protein kinase [Gaiellaceae bacterium]
MSEAPVPGQEVGPYRLDERLGQGATGVVYSATRDDGERVALKLLRPERAAESVSLARFVREARVAGGIDPRHVVPILELGEAGGITYLAMPYYDGGSLAQRIRERGRLELDETVQLAAQLGRGLDELHGRGVLHRDVKPSNVLLDAAGSAALADFGLARAVDSTRLTAEGQILGTPHYLAPELIEGLEASEASDIYALGCVLYECLVGEPPFAGRGITAIGFAHLAEPPPDPRERRPELSADLARALLTALEKDPEARPTSGTALARLLHVGHSA